jgi:exo-poly-alpha-galacturonosidase
MTTAAPRVVSITDAPYAASTAYSAAQNTPRIQAAINACPEGGKLVFPQGVFLSGALYLKSACTYEINGTLQGSDLASDYEWGNNRFAQYGQDGFGSIAYVTNYKGLLNTCGHYQDWAQRSGYVADNLCNDPHDIRITGTGAIIGSSGASPDTANRKYHLTTLAHQQRAAQGGDDARGDTARADLLVMTGVRGLFIGNLKIAYPANHTMFVGRSSNITLFNLNVSSMHGAAPLHNGDGVDLSTAWAAELNAVSGPVGLMPTNAYIIGNVFDNGDDCINLNAGDALPGVLTATPVNGVHVTNNLTLAGHGGLVLGSFTAAGFKNIIVQQNTFDGTLMGLRLKTDLRKGGGIAALSGQDVGLLAIDNQVHAVPDAAISILGSYSGATSFASASSPGHWKDITIDGMTGTAWGHAITTSSNPGHENQRIKVRNVHITGSAKGISLRGTQGAPAETSFTNVTSDKGPFVYTQGLLSEANFVNCTPMPVGL